MPVDVSSFRGEQADPKDLKDTKDGLRAFLSLLYLLSLSFESAMPEKAR